VVTRIATWPQARRFAVAWLYLGGYSLFAVVYAFLPARGQDEITGWSSTNLVNLRQHPVGSLVTSAFLPVDPAITWVILGALGLLAVNRLLGNVRAAVLVVTGHVAGTLVSEGIVGYQVSHAILPQPARTLVDVGPSYVLVCALVAATLYGSWWERAAAGAGFAVLSFHIFRGLSHLDVTATGHLVAAATGAVLGGLLLRSARAAKICLGADVYPPADISAPASTARGDVLSARVRGTAVAGEGSGAGGAAPGQCQPEPNTAG
jgi:hypothetical protein